MRKSGNRILFAGLSAGVLFTFACASASHLIIHDDSSGSPPLAISVTVSPNTATLQVNETHAFTAAILNDTQNKGVSWSLSGSTCTAAACGSLSATTTLSGVGVTYTAPSQAPAGPVNIAATSVADSTKFGTAIITVTTPPPAIAVNVAPAAASVQTQQSQSFIATVQNDSQNKGVTWTLSGGGCSGVACGTLSANSSATGAAITYTAPASVPNPASVTLTATSASDSTKSATATITIVAPPPSMSVSISPSSASIQAQQSQSFIATVQNDPQNKGVTWTLSGAGCTGVSCGTLSATSSASGAPVSYTAPASVPNPASVTLTAVSVSDSTKSAIATITVTAAPQPVTVGVSPASASVVVLQSQVFTATVQNDLQNKGVAWSLSGAGCSGSSCGTLSANFSASGAPMTYTAPALIPNPATVSLIATSIGDSTKSATATITVVAPAPAVSVSVSPATASVQTQQSQSFTASVQNDALNRGVTWTLSGSGCTGAGCGTISANASASGAPITYTAPANVPNPGSVTLTATSVSDTTKSASATITVTAPPPPISVNVSPASASVQVQQSQAFTATVQNDTQNKGVSWTLSGAGCTGAACGTISANTSASGASITYTAPTTVPNPASVTLTATSAADTTKNSSASITITPAPQIIVVNVAPTTQNVQINQSHDFTATVQNDPQNQGVSWSLSGGGCSGTACGTLSGNTSASGAPITYTAPATVPKPASVTLTATSVADNAKSSSATITIFQSSGNITVTISPKRGGIVVSQNLDFTATVQNDSGNQGVTWSASSGSFANVTPTSATYQAPSSPGVFQITATSVADPSKSASATLGITDLAGVSTYHNDAARDGANTHEYALTPSNVNSNTFGKLFSCAVDAAVYAQPLWMPAVSINGQTHNVLFVATSHDTVYAFDADASPCITYWSKHLIPSGETWLTANDLDGSDISPDLGIVGTPVIDPNTNILYVVAKTKNSGGDCGVVTNCHQRLHALRLADGTETASGPADISTAITVPGTGTGSSGGVLAFNPLRENQRPGLALANGYIYVGWGSQNERDPWHGWLMGFDKSNLSAAPGVFNATPDGGEGGTWMGGAAPAADTSGNVFIATGNGTFSEGAAYGDSIIKLGSPANGVLPVLDYFTPSNQAALSDGDIDLGSGGILLLPDLPAGAAHPHLLVQVGKGGTFYLVDRDTGSMGGYCNGCNDRIVQEVPRAIPGMWGMLAFWNNTIYSGGADEFSGTGDNLKAWPFNVGGSGRISTSFSSASSHVFVFPCATPSISANGLTNGVVWALDSRAFETGSTVLYAFDATNLANELWNSSQLTGDRAGGRAVKFTVPTVANGKVYVGTGSEIDVYGLKPN